MYETKNLKTSQCIWLKALLFIFSLTVFQAGAQNSLTGDGFGGRLWYKAYNYTVGSYSAYTVCGDSAQLYGWGANHHYELGDGTKINTVNPVKALGMTNVHYYSTGYNMGAIKKDSSGWVWGSPISQTPKKVLSNAKFLDAGAVMCSFVKHDGTVWTVGNNSSGAFGNDSINGTTTSFPRQASGINTAVRVAVARNNLAILLADGTVMTTGSNVSGMLGNGSSLSTIAKTPVQVKNLRKIVDIKATATNFAALDSYGYVYTWGSSVAIGNGYNMLDTPTLVPTLSNIVAISGCEDGINFLALDVSHNAYGWGPNYGILGTGNTTSYRHTTIQVASDVADIMCGETFSYIVKTDGTLWGTGRSNGGSIWMNIKDTVRYSFTQIDPTIAPLNLCELPPFAGNYFRVKTIPCLYDSIRLEAAPNDSFTNFHWDFGDGSPQEYGMTVKHKYNTTGAYTIRLMSVKKSDLRKDTAFRLLTINDASYAPLFNGDTLICGRVGYNKTPLNYDDESSYRWQNNWTGFTNYLSNPGLYILEVTDVNGCHYKDSFNVINHDVPKALFKADTYSICANSRDSIRFSNISTSNDSLVRCRWDFFEDTLSSTQPKVAFKFKKPGTIAVWLSVWTQYGCRNDTIDVFDILPAPKPTFSLTVKDSCLKNNSIVLNNLTARDTVNKPRFKWYFSEGFILSNRNPAGPRSYADTGRYYIDLIYVNENACTDTLRRYVHIYGHPKSGFTVNNPVCMRDSVPFAHSGTSPDYPLSFKWNFGDNAYSTLPAPKHKFAQKGPYRIVLCTSSPLGCTDSSVQTLTVHNPPRAGFSINDSLQCLLGNRFVFTSAAKTDTGHIVQTHWDFGDMSTDTGQAPLPKSYNNAGQYRVLQTVRDINGCTDSISFPVEIKNGPLVQIAVNRASQCEHTQHFILSYRPVSGNDSISGYNWKLNGVNYGDSVTLQLNTLLPGLHKVELILNTVYGCPGLNSRTLAVNPRPNAAIEVDKDSQCFMGHAFLLSNRSSIGSGSISSCKWKWSDGDSSTLTDPGSKRFNQYGIYQGYLHVVSDSACSNDDSIRLTLFPNPAALPKTPEPVCLGAETLFESRDSIAYGTVARHIWDFGDGSSGSGRQTAHRYPAAGSYTLVYSVFSEQGCRSDSGMPGVAIVYPLPKADFSYHVKEGEQNNHDYHFVNRSVPLPLQVRWNFGIYGQAARDSSISVTDTFSIPVTLAVTDNNGCADTSRARVFASGPLLVYIPDAFTPGDDGLNEVFLPGGVLNTAADYSMRIYNRWGELLFESTETAQGWDGRYKGIPQQQDVYVYVLDMKDRYNKSKVYRGTFTLLR